MVTEELQKEVLRLMELSSMDDQERTMWMILVPNMTEEELGKFRTVLDKEVTQLTDIYTKALKS